MFQCDSLIQKDERLCRTTENANSIFPFLAFSTYFSKIDSWKNRMRALQLPSVMKQTIEARMIGSTIPLNYLYLIWSDLILYGRSYLALNNEIHSLTRSDWTFSKTVKNPFRSKRPHQFCLVVICQSKVKYWSIENEILRHSFDTAVRIQSDLVAVLN